MQLEVQKNIYEQPQRAEFEVPWEHIGYLHETHHPRKSAKLLPVTLTYLLIIYYLLQVPLSGLQTLFRPPK